MSRSSTLLLLSCAIAGILATVSASSGMIMPCRGSTQPKFPMPAFSAVVDQQRNGPVYPSQKDLLHVSPIAVRIDSIERPQWVDTVQTLFRRVPTGWMTVTVNTQGLCTFKEGIDFHILSGELLMTIDGHAGPRFPTALAQINPPTVGTSSSRWFETTRESQVPEGAGMAWSSFIAPASYCYNEWQGLPRQDIRGCDAQQVHTVNGRPKTILRVHERARSSFDNSWTMKTTFNYSAGVPDPSMFDLPANWENACLNGDQRFLVEPPQGRVTTPTGDDFVFIRLQAPPAPALGDAHVSLAHGDFIKVIPSKLTFTRENWNEPQRVTLRYVREGEGGVTISGRGGGLDHVISTRFFVYACHGTPGWGCDRFPA